MATGINTSGIEQSRQLFDTWRQKVMQTIQTGANQGLSSSLKGSNAELTAKQVEQSLVDMITDFFNNATKDFDNLLANVVTNYQRQDESNSTFANLNNQLKS